MKLALLKSFLGILCLPVAASIVPVHVPDVSTVSSRLDLIRSLTDPSSPLSELVDGSKLSLRRRLGSDFDELNALFDGLVLALPDMYIDAGQILGATVQLWTSNLSCFSINIDDILLNYGRVSSTRFDFGVDIRGLGISCALNYKYKWSFMSGSGTGQIYTTNNEASTTIQFASTNFDQYPPSGSSVSECVANIQIDDMDFQGTHIV